MFGPLGYMARMWAAQHILLERQRAAVEAKSMEDCPVCVMDSTDGKTICTFCHVVHKRIAKLINPELTARAWWTPVTFYHPSRNQLCVATLRHPDPDDFKSESELQDILRTALFERLRRDTSWDINDPESWFMLKLQITKSSAGDVEPAYSSWDYLAHMQHTPEATAGQYGADQGPQRRSWAHPHLFASVFELRDHFRLPQHLADEVAREAQKFVGYWHGRAVESRQMTPIIVNDANDDIDPSVRLGGPWVEPFERQDSCAFCTEMTDDAVRRRIDSFTWAMDKELSNRFRSRGYPAWQNYPLDDWDARAEYRRLVHEWEAENPEALRSMDFNELPMSLQRALCIRWNHIFRDWLAADPRFCYRSGKYFACFAPQEGMGWYGPFYYATPDWDPATFEALPPSLNSSPPEMMEFF